MLKVCVCVSGGGTNLQAIIDAIKDGKITNAKIDTVISNNADAYALERAKQNGINALCLSLSHMKTEKHLMMLSLAKLKEINPDLIVLARGFLVVIPPQVIRAFRNRIINIHPSLIPSFCGTGYYGLKVHEAALERGVKITSCSSFRR